MVNFYLRKGRARVGVSTSLDPGGITRRFSSVRKRNLAASISETQKSCFWHLLVRWCGSWSSAQSSCSCSWLVASCSSPTFLGPDPCFSIWLAQLTSIRVRRRKLITILMWHQLFLIKYISFDVNNALLSSVALGIFVCSSFSFHFLAIYIFWWLSILDICCCWLLLIF